MPIKVIIVDDHEWIRSHFATLASENESFELIAQAKDATEGLEKIKALKPDVAVIDIELQQPGTNGLQLSRVIKQDCPDTDIVILTSYPDEAYFNEAMDLEIPGYVLKDKIDDLVMAVNQVRKGETYLSPKLHKYLIDRYQKRARFKKDTHGINQLTPQELKVLKHVAENFSNKEIADKLFIAVSTVENHRNSICRKLGLKGRNALLVFALKNKHHL